MLIKIGFHPLKSSSATSIWHAHHAFSCLGDISLVNNIAVRAYAGQPVSKTSPVMPHGGPILGGKYLLSHGSNIYSGGLQRHPSGAICEWWHAHLPTSERIGMGGYTILFTILSHTSMVLEYWCLNVMGCSRNHGPLLVMDYIAARNVQG